MNVIKIYTITCYKQKWICAVNSDFKKIYNLLIVGFGIFLIVYRGAWATKLAESQKIANSIIKRPISNEANNFNYAKRITLCVGVVFILAGIYSILNN